MGELHQLPIEPVQPVTCLDCFNSSVGHNGIYCRLFAQLIIDERAEDCRGFCPITEPDPW